nr:hypothetical protein [uncultured archaeon]
MEGEVEIGKKQRKIFKVGDSKVVSLPPEFLRQHDIKEGDEVEVLFNDIVQIEAVDEENVHKEMESRDLKKEKKSN